MSSSHWILSKYNNEIHVITLQFQFIYTVEPWYSKLIGGVVCSDSEMFGLSEKRKQKHVQLQIQR